ncbi:MAG: hypothetical protein SFU98_06605 [Leptospiraceae bacterium]|nr:hypothetical protein [Leptospiraceae bacterium]
MKEKNNITDRVRVLTILDLCNAAVDISDSLQTKHNEDLELCQSRLTLKLCEF